MTTIAQQGLLFPETLEFGLTDRLVHYRNLLHRCRCAAAANRAVAMLAEMGIKSRIFGGLTLNPEDYHPGSSVDICIFDDSPQDAHQLGPDGPRYRDIMQAVTSAGEGLVIQVHFFSHLSPPLARLVQATGVPHIN